MAFGFNILMEKENGESNHDDQKVSMYPKHGISNPYTKDALIIQSTLEYNTSTKYNSFTSRQLLKDYLLEKCIVFRNKYTGSAAKTKKEARIENNNPLIVRILEKLIFLQLISKEPFISKNKEQTEKYQFTLLGKMIGSLIWYKLTSNTNVSKEDYKQLFNNVCKYYQSLKNSSAKFCLLFFKNCFENNLFNFIINYFINLLENASDDKNDFLFQIKFLHPFFSNNKELFKIYQESLSELARHNKEIHNIVLLNIKLSIEEQQESKCVRFREFEMERFSSIEEIDMVVLEGFCFGCRNFFIVTMKTLEYLKSIVAPPILKTTLSSIVCTVCKNSYLDFQTINPHLT